MRFSETVALGLAPDGGLFLPEQLPDIRPHLESWARLNYPELCLAFVRLFADDLDETALKQCVDDAYARFDHPAIAPLREMDDKTFVLELFHGPTLAFKDFALQWLGGLYGLQIQQSKAALTVLGATSGDTGAAAIHGLLGQPEARIFILYPHGRIAPLQERQMTCTGAENVFPIAIDGSFDDAQRMLKASFGDAPFQQKCKLSAVNSINLARILAQCVYYLYAWFQLPEAKRKAVEFVVPTGNFGNILAGWLVKKMGLPVQSFRVATNQNDILYRLFTTGLYAVDRVQPSLAPSMDIQVASNFERFIYYAEGGDSERVRDIMETFRQTGQYRFEHFDSDGFTASRTTDEEIVDIIQRVYRQYNYVVDPHTACGFKEHDPEATSVVLATAHPAKIPEAIDQAIGISPKSDTLEQLKERTPVSYRLKADETALKQFILDTLAES